MWQHIFRITMLSRAGDIDCRTARQGALCFADATTDTELIDDIRLLNRYFFPAIIQHYSRTKFDRLIGGRTMFFTDDAGQR